MCPDLDRVCWKAGVSCSNWKGSACSQLRLAQRLQSPPCPPLPTFSPDTPEVTSISHGQPLSIPESCLPWLLGILSRGSPLSLWAPLDSLSDLGTCHLSYLAHVSVNTHAPLAPKLSSSDVSPTESFSVVQFSKERIPRRSIYSQGSLFSKAKLALQREIGVD